MPQRIGGQDPSKYLGVRAPNPPTVIQAQRAPTTSDTKFDVGTIWINVSSDQAWFLTSVAAASATWALASPGASDVDTLTGDVGGAISPAAGNITLAGGTNITTTGGANTITFALDAAVTLATSLTVPTITSSGADLTITADAGQDVDITAPAGQNIVLKMGDAAGLTKVSFTDSADAEVAAIDSNGGFSMGAITFTGLLTASASATIDTAGTALSLATDNSGDAVILGGGTVARAITIGQDAAAHTVAIGQAAAGAITIDTAAGVSIDGVTASNFTLSGAGADLTLSSAAGRVIVNGEEAAANAVTLLSAAGGIDADCALQMNLASSQAAADAVRIDASDAAGGIDVDDGGGGMTFDSLGAISIDAAAASNFSVSGAGIDLSLVSAAGRVIVNGEEAAANAVTLLSAAGGIDADCALQMNLASSQAAADAVRIVASDAAGGIDIDDGGGGIAIDGAGAISIDSAAASNFSVTGAGIDLTLASAGGRVVMNGEEAAADALRLLSAAGGLDCDVALQMNLTSSQNAGDAIRINASAGGIDIDAAGAAGEDITINNAAGSISIVAAEAAGDAIVIQASDAAGGIDIIAGTGTIDLQGDVDVSTGDLMISGAAQQLQVEGGAATDFIGQATLTNGQVTVANTNIAATDRIFLTRSAINASTALGHLLTTISAGASFTIEAKQAATPGSDETGDQSTLDYFIVRQL